MRSFTLFASLCFLANAQTLVEVDQIHLDLGLREGEALYRFSQWEHVPGEEASRSKGVIALLIDQAAPDGSAWISLSYKSLKQAGRALSESELQSLNASLSAFRIQVGPDWTTLAIQGPRENVLDRAEERYHEALDRYLDGEAAALFPLAARGFRLMLLRGADRLSKSDLAHRILRRAGRRGLQSALIALEEDSQARLDRSIDQKLGEVSFISKMSLTGKYLDGIQPVFRVEEETSIKIGEAGFEVSQNGLYNSWGLPRKLEGDYEYYIGPFGGSSRFEMELLSFGEPSEGSARPE